uniref:Uncharacterized protein n=1 Tax=Wuchereria bancrofti TaxID=6293 RepID=A0AAF5PKU7_WUCBA
MPFRYQRLLLFSSSENVILLQLNPVTLLDLDIVLHLIAIQYQIMQGHFVVVEVVMD